MSPSGLFALSNPCVTRASSSLMIYESLGAVWAVAAMRYPTHEFVDHLRVPRGRLRCRIRAPPVTAVR